MGKLVCAIHQPNFFPRLSTLAKLMAADIWVVLDDVQFTRRDYQHRCRLATLNDATVQQWLTLPVHLRDGRSTPIQNVQLAEPATSRKRADRLIQHHYRRSPHWPTLNEPLREVFDAFDHTDQLAEVSETSTRILLRLLNWPGTILHSSTIRARTGRSERLADLTHAVGADTYLCGTGGARYLTTDPFTAYGLRIEWFTTPQLKNPAIWINAHHITALRALMLAGPAALAEALREPFRINVTGGSTFTDEFRKGGATMGGGVIR